VFRGFLEETNQLKFVTDARSEKVNQIDYSAWGEICWYFTKTREQFRLMGQLTLVNERYPDPALSKARQSSWQELSDSARTQFAWDYPGKLRFGDEGFNVPPPDPTLPLPHFCLMLLEPEQVDHLELRGNPQNRWLYLREGQNWSIQEVNP
jgi:PPOX class probable FMN-dependent enzyme